MRASFTALCLVAATLAGAAPAAHGSVLAAEAPSTLPAMTGSTTGVLRQPAPALAGEHF